MDVRIAVQSGKVKVSITIPIVVFILILSPLV
jgi:hypothetical protein